MIFIKIAWRNIFRNKRRTFLAGSAIGIGLASLIFMDALITGMRKSLVNTATSLVGEAQIHEKNFLQTQETNLVINHLAELEQKLQKDPLIPAYTKRTIALGMITSTANVSCVLVSGINPKSESLLSNVKEKLISGSYFKNNNPRNILIGKKLAELLEVELESRIVLTLSNTNGDISQELFRVSGIYTFGNKEMDQGMVFIHLDQAQKMLGLSKNEVHEIAMKFIDNKISLDQAHPVWKEYSSKENEIKSWTGLLPQLKTAFELIDLSVKIVVGIALALIALIVVNTLFMSLYDRMYEFGILKALGTKPAEVFKLILFEGLSLGICSITMGTVSGFIVTFFFTYKGFDYRGVEVSGVTFQEVLYPVLHISPFFLYPTFLLFFIIMVSIYPAVYAVKMNALEAMKKT